MHNILYHLSRACIGSLMLELHCTYTIRYGGFNYDHVTYISWLLLLEMKNVTMVASVTNSLDNLTVDSWNF